MRRVRPAPASVARARHEPNSIPRPVASLRLGLAGVGVLVGALVAGAASCGSSPPSPFVDGFDPGLGGQGWGGDANGGAGGGGGDPQLGGPCDIDAQCDDAVDCTFDACDQELGRCRFVPDDSQCQNGVFCDGVERCEQKLGCRPGAPKTCSQGDACLIASCVEAEQLCSYRPRDVDGDGDPDAHCEGGGDCDDADPVVSSQLPEVCANGKDDDCDGTLDEADCSAAAHDTCADPLPLTGSGTYALDTSAAALDYAASCALSAPTSRDVVAAVVLPAGPLVDVELTARAVGAANVALAAFSQCAPGSELACSPSYASLPSGHLAKLRVRGVGDATQQTALPIYVYTDYPAAVTLELSLLPLAAEPTNETCGTAQPLAPSVPVVVELVDAAEDVASACSSATGELVYSFSLAADADVDLFAVSLDGDGQPSISLRSSSCALVDDEIACQTATNAFVHRTALPAGTYYVAVAATAPTTASITLEVGPATVPPADDACATAPLLAPNSTIGVSLAQHQDDFATGCVAGAVDAAYDLELAQASDVLLVGRKSQGDTTAVALLWPGCSGPGDTLVCATSGYYSPVRASKRNVAAGGYRVAVESTLGQPMQLTAFVRDAVPPTIVPFADGCADVLAIPSTGGFFQGTTANASNDFTAGCDVGGNQAVAPEQLLRLDLLGAKRVVLDMGGSAYSTLLDVRKGPSCPGVEVSGGCAAGYDPSRSYLDLQLDAGTYFIQVDGYAGASGPWFLDVRVVDP